jgi:hypothetical protein
MVNAMEQASVSAVGGEVERRREARQKLHQVRQILMTPSPERLGDCGPVLEEAAGLLASLPDYRKSGPPVPFIEELQALRRDLSVVTALIQQAAGYYLGWAQILGAATSGYTNQGDAAPLVGYPQVSVEG